MATKKPKGKAKSGWAKMKATGKRAIMIGVTPEHHALLVRAAAAELRPVSQFVTFHAIEAAKRLCPEE